MHTPAHPTEEETVQMYGDDRSWRAQGSPPGALSLSLTLVRWQWKDELLRQGLRTVRAAWLQT